MESLHFTPSNILINNTLRGYPLPYFTLGGWAGGGGGGAVLKKKGWSLVMTDFFLGILIHFHAKDLIIGIITQLM